MVIFQRVFGRAFGENRVLKSYNICMKYIPLLFPLFMTIIFFSGCESNTAKTYQGYVEGEFVNISSSQSGRLDKLFIKRGESISKNTNLFALECENELLALQQVSAELFAAQATLLDYTKGSRPEEIDVIEAQLSQAKAASENAAIQLSQNKALFLANAASKTQFEDSTALAKSTAARVQELQHALNVARLPKRTDQISAQEARIAQLHSALAQAQWRVDEKALKSPYNALVFDTLYREGEFVPAGGIIVRLLPPENIKIRFFVPQAVAETLKISDSAVIISRADGQKIPVRITYISTEAEYTPPVIYSNETKEKLTYMIEATPSAKNAPTLHPGQPVEVSLE